jgi:hypothetical protein
VHLSFVKKSILWISVKGFFTVTAFKTEFSLE